MTKPILFNTEMVRAIMDGRKTQTRRLPSSRIRDKWCDWDEYQWEVAPPGSVLATEKGFYENYPPYEVGDVLWVRETWKRAVPGIAGPGLIDYYLYKADEPHDISCLIVENRWHPSIHMPYEAARLFLRVKNVRVERLQDMTPYDCIHDGGFAPEAVDAVGVEALFKPLWNSTIKKINWSWCGWSANPWVWVIDFEAAKK